MKLHRKIIQEEIKRLKEDKYPIPFEIQTALMFYEDFSLMVKIEGREYYIIDMEERSNAIEHINRLLVPNAVQPIEEPEEEPADDADTGGDTGGGADDIAMEPEEEPAAEEPADEEEMV